MKSVRNIMVVTAMTTALTGGLLAATQQSASAWATQQSASAVCVATTGTVDVNGLFKNTEPSSMPSNYDMQVTMTRILPGGGDGEKTPMQLVARQTEKSFVIHTNLTSIAAGKVRFDLKWANGSGYDKRYANFNAVTDCKKEVAAPPQPPSQDPCNQPGVTDNVAWVPATGPADDADHDWTLNPDTSLTVVPQAGKKYPGDQFRNFVRPADSGVKCPMPPLPPLPPEPEPVVKYAAKLKANCVTENYGEYQGLVRNYKRSTESVVAKVRINGELIVRDRVVPGEVFRFDGSSVAVGSKVKLVVGGKVVKAVRVPDGCEEPPVTPGGLKTVAAKKAAAG